MFCSDKCRQWLHRHPPMTEPTRLDRKYIYLVRCNEFYKIGITTDDHPTIKDRMSSMRNGNPYPINLVFKARVNSAEKLERALHTCFKAKWIQGEWFNLDSVDVGLVIRFFVEHATLHGQ